VSEWKYIVFDTPMAGDTIVIFPFYVEHFAMSKALVGPILSAGFLHYNSIEKRIICHGKSVSLGVECRGVIDSRLATKFLDW